MGVRIAQFNFNVVIISTYEIVSHKMSMGKSASEVVIKVACIVDMNIMQITSVRLQQFVDVNYLDCMSI